MAPTDHTAAGVALTEWTSCGGCAAKWGATLLGELVTCLPAGMDPALLVGLAPFDDAALYRVSEDVALVSTTVDAQRGGRGGRGGRGRRGGAPGGLLSYLAAGGPSGPQGPVPDPSSQTRFHGPG